MLGALTLYIQTQGDSLSDALHDILARLLQKQVTEIVQAEWSWSEKKKQMPRLGFLPCVSTNTWRAIRA